MRVEKQEYVNFNGCEHFLYHKGNNKENPVIIFLHGGPGSSELVFAHAFQDKWEEYFTIVHYDQRGAGKTYLKNKKLPRPHFEDLVSDLGLIVEYVRKEYAKEKVIILGHSFGSMLGSIYVKRFPQNILAYIGTGQVIDFRKNETVGLEKLKEAINESGNKNDLKKVESFGNFPHEKFFENIAAVRRLQGKYKLSAGGLKEIKIAFKSGMFGITGMLALLKSADVNKEIIKELLSISLDKEGYFYEVPVFYILGENDWQTPFAIASEYFDKVKAPYKELFWLKDAGHFGMLENKDDFDKFMIEEIRKHLFRSKD